jgi:hypothetical protein
MKKGEIVTVYEDPITEKRVEGEGTILRVIETNADGLALCVVRFPGEIRGVYRLLKVKTGNKR